MYLTSVAKPFIRFQERFLKLIDRIWIKFFGRPLRHNHVKRLFRNIYQESIKTSTDAELVHEIGRFVVLILEKQQEIADGPDESQPFKQRHILEQDINDYWWHIKQIYKARASLKRKYWVL